jgi:single-strand DNA-binding protein
MSVGIGSAVDEQRMAPVNETMTTVVGNVITEVKQRRITDGTRVASFRMASNERRFDKETQEWVNGDSLFVTVTCWRKLALGVCASLMKGDPVMVTGRLFTRGYEIEGQKRSVTELEAVAVGPDLSRCFADVSRASRRATEDVPAEAAPDDAASTPVGASASSLAAADAGALNGTEAVDAAARGPLVPVPTQDERRPSAKGEKADGAAPQLAVVGSS